MNIFYSTIRNVAYLILILSHPFILFSPSPSLCASEIIFNPTSNPTSERNDLVLSRQLSYWYSTIKKGKKCNPWTLEMLGIGSATNDFISAVPFPNLFVRHIVIFRTHTQIIIIFPEFVCMGKNVRKERAGQHEW
jgi:hypothetical protein